MRYISEILHIDSNKVIIRVEALLDNKSLGTAIGEASNSQEAEDKAIERINKRLNANKNEANEQDILNNSEKKDHEKEVNKNHQYSDKVNKDNATKIKLFEKNSSEDWSIEIEDIVRNIKILGWSNKDESKFLKDIFNVNDRNRIVNYTDIVTYMFSLKIIIEKKYTKDQISKRKLMTDISNYLIHQKNLSTEDGREFINKHFNISRRDELEDIEYKSFITSLYKYT
tara:strand:+ start:10019 stop:10699 length:681 start_codon:yes stop_codon:yes gene_type:complete